MSESSPAEDESGLEEEGDSTARKPPSTGARLWDRVRGRLIKPKVKTGKLDALKDKLPSSFLCYLFESCIFLWLRFRNWHSYAC